MPPHEGQPLPATLLEIADLYSYLQSLQTHQIFLSDPYEKLFISSLFFELHSFVNFGKFIDKEFFVETTLPAHAGQPELEDVLLFTSALNENLHFLQIHQIFLLDPFEIL